MNSITDAEEYFDQIFENILVDQEKILTTKFTDCKFVKCSFESAKFSNCRFFNCTFQECDLSLAQITGSSFPSTRFERSKLIGVNWTQGNWSLSNLNKLDGFFDCMLNHSTFIGLNLKGIQIKNCLANEVDFREADLSKANFEGTDLHKSLFNHTNLTEADLSQARNYQIDAGTNILKQAKFSLPEAMGLLYSMDIVLEEQGNSNF